MEMKKKYFAKNANELQMYKSENYYMVHTVLEIKWRRCANINCEQQTNNYNNTNED